MNNYEQNAKHLKDEMMNSFLLQVHASLMCVYVFNDDSDPNTTWVSTLHTFEGFKQLKCGFSIRTYEVGVEDTSQITVAALMCYPLK